MACHPWPPGVTYETESFPVRVTLYVPFWDPLGPFRSRVPLNLRAPLAPLVAPVPPVALAVPLKVTVTGPESPERYEELAAAVDEHCPVLDLFANPVPVTRTLAG